MWGPMLNLVMQSVLGILIVEDTPVQGLGVGDPSAVDV